MWYGLPFSRLFDRILPVIHSFNFFYPLFAGEISHNCSIFIVILVRLLYCRYEIHCLHTRILLNTSQKSMHCIPYIFLNEQKKELDMNITADKIVCRLLLKNIAVTALSV